ncbi:MAG: hypothetical protein GXP60_07100 [Epsilonproteobacteria bacterium]|nr:hypothetical protein [Campylobacterota bacterium]
MAAKLNIRWHGRAGQGAVTAAKTIAELVAQDPDKYVQGFAIYGAEKRGAPVAAFTRIENSPIRRHSLKMIPDVVVLLDPSLVGIVDISEGAKKGASFIINSPKTKKEIIKELGIDSELFKTYVVDANKISREELGKAIPNAPMMGAVAKITGIFSKEEIMKTTKEIFEEQGKFSNKIIEGNLRSIGRAFEEVS